MLTTSRGEGLLPTTTKAVFATAIKCDWVSPNCHSRDSARKRHNHAPSSGLVNR
jgi:hypothetical protein